MVVPSWHQTPLEAASPAQLRHMSRCRLVSRFEVMCCGSAKPVAFQTASLL